MGCRPRSIRQREPALELPNRRLTQCIQGHRKEGGEASRSQSLAHNQQKAPVWHWGTSAPQNRGPPQPAARLLHLSLRSSPAQGVQSLIPILVQTPHASVSLPENNPPRWV